MTTSTEAHLKNLNSKPPTETGIFSPATRDMVDKAKRFFCEGVSESVTLSNYREAELINQTVT